MRITVVYDNEAKPPFKSDWGFACLIESKDHAVMFDTGARSDILIYNLSKLGLVTKKIDAIVLSHDHFDHTGGLDGILELQPDVKIIEPSSLSTPTELFPGITSSGIIGVKGAQEQSLFCSVENGLVVVTGCSHPGLGNIIKVARDLGRIHAVVGGFHGFDNYNALEGISVIIPCHCTSHKHDIQLIYPNSYRECGVGNVFKFKG
jgi:7,8-dihydropterin-6-yl-methyl-4-(beta-D-ribofuranosyl)aminobenzene 5'-phosphate synthase